MIRKYQNELMVLIGVLLLLGGIGYQQGMIRRLDASLALSRSAAQEITETKTLQKVWGTKGIKGRIAALRRAVSPDKVKMFDQKKTKLNLHFADLTGAELNAVSTKIASLPVRIQEFAITRTGSQYEMRCTCAW